MTKSALLREAQTRDQLRKEFLLMQEAVKATEILIPFVFYDGTNIPGGVCKVKKGDYVWVMLDRSRKVGAQLGAGGNEKVHSRREWARVGVDDLMLVRGEIIIPHVCPFIHCLSLFPFCFFSKQPSINQRPSPPRWPITLPTKIPTQHYELYYFIVNKTLGPTNIPLFDYSSTLNPPPPPLSSRGDGDQQQQQQPQQQPPPLEGSTADPNFTKVVDRRWYERNKHIFPASVWEEFDPGRDYGKGKRSDKEGNAFFFS
jgi:protein FAM50